MCTIGIEVYGLLVGHYLRASIFALRHYFAHLFKLNFMVYICLDFSIRNRNTDAIFYILLLHDGFIYKMVQSERC